MYIDSWEALAVLIIDIWADRWPSNCRYIFCNLYDYASHYKCTHDNDSCVQPFFFQFCSMTKRNPLIHNDLHIN